MGKTYSIRKVEGGGVSSRPLKKKTSVGLFSTFRHPLATERIAKGKIADIPVFHVRN